MLCNGEYILQILERYWLRSSDFVAGEEISIADLLMVTELDMLHMLAGSIEVIYPQSALA